jgi:hypothetical protein
VLEKEGFEVALTADLAQDHTVLGVIRQQLLRDPRVPCTKNNSSKAILLADEPGIDLLVVIARVRSLMLADFQPGSDPGLCVARKVPAEVIAFGARTQRELLTQDEAYALAHRHGIHLEELGGDGMGVIGALAAVGLTAGGEAGRYIELGQVRALQGIQPVEQVLAAGIAAVQTVSGQPMMSGQVQTDGLRPARRGGRAVAVVEAAEDVLLPLKMD